MGKKRLQVRVELEAPDAVLVDQPPRLPRARHPARGIDAGERDQDVGVGRRRLGDLLVADAARARTTDSASTVNTTAAIVALAVVGGDVGGRRQTLAGVEVLRRSLPQLRRHRVVPVRGDLGVGVHVDGADPVDVDHSLQGTPTNCGSEGGEIGRLAGRV